MNGEQKMWSVIVVSTCIVLTALIAGITYYNVKITEEAIKAGLHQTRTTSGATIWTKPARYAPIDEEGRFIQQQ